GSIGGGTVIIGGINGEATDDQIVQVVVVAALQADQGTGIGLREGRGAEEIVGARIGALGEAAEDAGIEPVPVRDGRGRGESGRYLQVGGLRSARAQDQSGFSGKNHLSHRYLVSPRMSLLTISTRAGTSGCKPVVHREPAPDVTQLPPPMPPPAY